MRRAIIVIAVAAVPATIITGTAVDTPAASASSVGPALAQATPLRASSADAVAFRLAGVDASTTRPHATGDPAAPASSEQIRAGGPASETLPPVAASALTRVAARPVARAPPALSNREV